MYMWVTEIYIICMNFPFTFQSLPRSDGQIKDSVHSQISDTERQSSEREDCHVSEEHHRRSLGHLTPETQRKSDLRNQIGGTCKWRRYLMSKKLTNISRSVSAWTWRTRTGTPTLTPLSTDSGHLARSPLKVAASTAGQTRVAPANSNSESNIGI